MAPIVPAVTAPITLGQYAQTLPETSVTRTFVENMVAESDLLRAFPMMAAAAGKREFLDIAGLPAVQFRGLNAPGNESTGAFNLREEDTFFIDEYIKVDRALVDRLGPSHRLKQEKLKTTALSQMFSQKIIKGDNTSNPSEPSGLQVRCNNLSYNLLHNSTAAGGAPLSLGYLDALYWLVNKPTHYIFPRGLMPFMEIAMRNINLTGQSLTVDTDNLGRRFMKYKDLPILYGYDPDDSPDLLPFTEVGAGGGAAQTASIYCISLRDGGLYGIEQTPLDVRDEGQIIGAPFLSTHIKWDWGIAREHPRACARLDSINAATVVA